MVSAVFTLLFGCAGSDAHPPIGPGMLSDGGTCPVICTSGVCVEDCTGMSYLPDSGGLPPPPSGGDGGTRCTPRQCGTFDCGRVSDQCGGYVECRACDGGTSGGGGGTGAGNCEPRTCTSVDCGVLNNGCGGTINCGACDGSSGGGSGGGSGGSGSGCTRTTCAAAGAQCGTIPDGCGGTLTCGSGTGGGCGAGGSCASNVCSCSPDAAERNDTSIAAHALGLIEQGYPTTYRTFTGSVGSASDVDWFSAPVTDTWLGGWANPQVRAVVDSDQELEVSVFVHCNSGMDNHACDTGLPFTDETGFGCTTDDVAPLVAVATGCTDGWDESSTVLVRVRSPESTRGCVPYTLIVEAL